MQSVAQTSFLGKSPLRQRYGKRWRLLLAASLGLTLWSGSMAAPTPAMTVYAVPNPRHFDSWISDTQDLISPQSEAALNQQLTALEANTGTEMAIVTVDNTSGSDSPKAFATELFNTWGIGKIEQDNGVLFLVSVGDRRTEVEVGYGLTDVLTKSEIERLLEKDAVPHFKQGDFDRGIVLATESIIAQLAAADGAVDRGPIGGPNSPNSLLNTDATDSPASSSSPSISGGVRVVSEQPLVIKILTIGSGAIAFIFVRFGTSLLTASTALKPGSSHRCGWVDMGSISQTMRFGVVGFVSLFGLGAIAALLTGISSPIVGGTALGLAGAIGFTVKKRSQEGVMPFRCEDCDVSLNKVDSSALAAHLSKAQNAATELGSAKYTGWECPTCAGVSIRCVYPWSRYKQCPCCQEPTVEQNSTVVTQATYHHSGRKKITLDCYCCDYSHYHFVTLPRLQESTTSSSSYHSGGGFGGGGGGDFGGGSSGGGGGGADW